MEEMQVDFPSHPGERVSTIGATAENCPVLLGKPATDAEGKNCRSQERCGTTAEPELKLPAVATQWPPSDVADDPSPFMKQATKGHPCTVLSSHTFKRSNGEYSIDETTRELTVHLTPVVEPPIFKCSICAIRDVYTVEDDGKECFSPDLLEVLDDEEMGR